MKRQNNVDEVDQIVGELEEDIIFGRLLQRERIIEDDLIERFGVNRYVVRKALAELERLGIVIKIRNRGVIVRGFDKNEVEAIYEMRELLHEKAILRMPFPVEEAVISRLESIHRRHLAAMDNGNLRTIYLLNNEFHETLFGACGNAYLADTIMQYDSLSHPIRSLRIGDAQLLAAAAAEHAQMIDALRAQDRERLKTLCVEHIRPSKNAYLEIYGRDIAR